MTEQVDQQLERTMPQAANDIPASYEVALHELEALVTRMESGALSLEESLTAYRRGAALVKHCQKQLETVEQQVRVLDGEIFQPFSTTEVASSADTRE